MRNKNVLTILFLLCVGLGYSQSIKGLVVSFDEIYNSKERKNKLFIKATLLHNVGENVYVVGRKQIDEKNENKGVTEVKTLTEVPYQIYFKDYEKGTIIRQIGEKNSTSLLSKLNEINWTLKKEEKKIAGLLCKKAIAETKKGKVVAWYTEDLSVKGGPREYDGLPGLILYLKNDYFTYKAVKIEKKFKKSILPQKDKTTTLKTLTELKKGITKTKMTSHKSH